MDIKQKTYLILGVFLIVIVFLFLGAVKPMILEIKNASAEAGQSRGKLLLLEKTDQDYLEQIEIDYKEINDNVNLIKSGLISNNQAVNFFMELEKIASATSNHLEIRATEFPVLTLNLTGTFPGVMKFLGWLENGNYFLDVYFIQLKLIGEAEAAEGTSLGEIKVNIKIKVYTK